MNRLIILLFLFANTICAQTSDSSKFQYKNSVQLEIGGHGGYYSVCYERIVLNGNRFKTAVQAGVAYYPPKTGILDLWIPIVANEIISFNKHHIEIGIGYIFIYESHRYLENNPNHWEWNHFITGRIGYRYQKPNGRLIVRAGFTPIMEGLPTTNWYGFHPLGGVALGYSF